MSAATTRPQVAVPLRSVAPPRRSVVPVLAVAEARRLMLHPLTLVGFAWFVVGTASTVLGHDPGPRASFEGASLMLTFAPGVFLILSGNLVATRDRRAGAEEMLTPVPGRPEERLWALLLGSVAPAGAGAALVLLVHVFQLLDDRYVVAPGFWHLAAGPVTIVGATAYGAMIGLWLPGRAAAVVGVVVMIAANVWLDGQDPGALFGTVMAWAEWGTFDDSWGGLAAGSPAWHLGYLLSLTAMAAAAAWLRVAARRSGPVLLGLVAVGCALLTGLAQLP